MNELNRRLDIFNAAIDAAVKFEMYGAAETMRARRSEVISDYLNELKR